MTKKEITNIVKEGATGEYSHLIIYCDHFDYTYGIRYVRYGEDVQEKIDSILSGGSVGMFSIKEVYNYSLDINVQLEEKRAYHIEPLVKLNLGEGINMTDNLNKAIKYALNMHKGQKRKDGTPYIMHPLNVARRVFKYKKSKKQEVLLVSAILHDTIEDTDATYYDIVNNFGVEVASIVSELTTDKDMKNKLGKEEYLSIKMKNMTSWALVIKLCDRLDNVCDLVNCNDNNFRNRYILETMGIMNYIMDNRKLSNTQLNIIETIIYELLNLCRYDEDKTKVIIDLLYKSYNKKNELNDKAVIVSSDDEFIKKLLF